MTCPEGTLALYTDIDPYCCAVLGARVEDGSLPPGDVVLADVRDLTAEMLSAYLHVHLFAGIGGFPLGLAWAGFPLDRSIVTFGFPCQDISAAGKGAGLDGDRSGLFWEACRVVTIRKPEMFIAENVGALSRRGLDVVAAAMVEAGYVVPEAYRVGAWSVGAAHERERWWIVGWRREGSDAASSRGGRVSVRPQRPDEAAIDADGSGAREALQPHTGSKRRQAVGERSAGAIAHEPVPVQPDAQRAGRQAGSGDGGDQSGAGRWWDQSARRDRGWQPPVSGPWRRVRDEWQYAGPPVLVYAGGAGLWQRDAATVAGGARFAPRRSDPSIKRGHTVPVLPGYEQHPWEFPRLHQRGMGDAVHGLSGRLADTFNRLGVMALGNAVVPQVVAAIGQGVIAGLGKQGEMRAAS